MLNEANGSFQLRVQAWFRVKKSACQVESNRVGIGVVGLFWVELFELLGFELLVGIGFVELLGLFVGFVGVDMM